MVRRAHMVASLAITAGLFAACRDEPTATRLRPAELTPLSTVLLIDYGTATELRPGTVTPFNPLTVATEGQALTAAGDVIGSVGATPTIWPAGATEPRVLPTPVDATAAFAFDANDAGDVVGWARLIGGDLHRPVVWPAGGGEPRYLDGFGVEGYAINNVGDVAGTAGRHAALWSGPGGPRELGELPGAHACAAEALNDRRDVVGWCWTAVGTSAALWRAGVTTPRELPGLGGQHSYAVAVNAAGDVVGYSQTPGNEATHAMLWPADGGPPRVLAALPGAIRTLATAINDRGDIVGHSADQAVLWPAGGAPLHYLGTLGRGYAWPRDINPAGQILVQAGGGRAFLLNPSTPPSGDGVPTVLVGGVYTGTEGTPLAFDRSSATDPEGEALTYAWDFGDGTTSSEVRPAHIYVDQGTYTATLTVTDPAGHSSTGRATVIVDNARPVVTTTDRDLTLVESRSLTQTASFSDAGSLDSPWTYRIDWGDLTKSTGPLVTQGALPTKNHTYTTPGKYRLEVSVRDKDGGAGGVGRTITVVPNQTPVASANGPYAGTEGGNITFSSAGSTDGNGDVLKYRWTFGDGSSSTVANPTRKYADNGTYTVTLTVTDPSNATHTATTTAVVTNVVPTASLGAPGSIKEGAAYTVSISASDVGTVDRPTLEYALDCGSGTGYGPWSTTVKSVSCPPLPDQLALPLTPRGKVRDKDGGEREVTRSVPVGNAIPVVAFNATTATSIAVGGSVSFQASFTDAGVNDQPWTWTVVWGDGTPAASGVSTQQGDLGTLTHTYAKAGIFSAYFKVVDKDGSSRTSAKVAVTVSP